MAHKEDLMWLYICSDVPTYPKLYGDNVLPAIEQLVVQYHPEYKETYNDKI